MMSLENPSLSMEIRQILVNHSPVRTGLKACLRSVDRETGRLELPGSIFEIISSYAAVLLYINHSNPWKEI
jgi:hypothetical protein